jgi:formylglycine-generating enzyme required for sulfatase activity
MTAAINNINAENRNVTGTPVSKKNSVPWNYIDYTNAKANAESMYSNAYIQSGLVTGTQWDTLMKWLENAGYNVQTEGTAWGNFNNAPVTNITQYSNGAVQPWTTVSPTTKPQNKLWLLKTGNSEYTKANNIYDLGGNLWEWSSEIYSPYPTCRSYRGAAYNNSRNQYRSRNS